MYDRFINQIQHVSKQENQSKPDSLHVLARIRERLTRLLETCCDRKSMQYALIKSALSLIEFEKKLIYLQLKYPGVKMLNPNVGIRLSKSRKNIRIRT